METKIIEGIVINIFTHNDTTAKIKVLTKDSIIFVLAKGFFSPNSKNRFNVFIGSYTEFEIFTKYSTEKMLFLKKATIIQYIDLENKNNQFFIQKLFYILQLIDNVDSELLQQYTNFLTSKKKDEQLPWFISYFFYLIIKNNGYERNLNYCVVCKQNKNLYCFNWLEGGMFCYEHYFKKNKNNIYELNFIKSIYFLGLNFDSYVFYTNKENNYKIFNLLKNFESY